MQANGTHIKELPRGECLRLIATVAVGRIIYTRHALPAVELSNFVIDHGDIVIRTDPSGKLATAIRGVVVAFEADYLNSVDRTAWIITAIGHAHEVGEPVNANGLRQIGLSAPGEHECFIRISPGILNGRMIRSSHPLVTGTARDRGVRFRRSALCGGQPAGSRGATC